VIAPLHASVAAVLEGSPGVEVVFRRATASYAVFHYRFRDRGASTVASRDPAMTLKVYERHRLTPRYKGTRVRMRTAYGLPEFDSLSFVTELVASAVLRLDDQPLRTALVLNPGQGFLPSMLWARLKPDEIRLVDRDLLALRFTEANLVGNGCPPGRIRVNHQAEIDQAQLRDADLAIGLLRPKEPPNSAAATVRHLLSEIPRGGRVVLGGSSTTITRSLIALEDARLPSNVVDRRRNKGFSAVVLQRPANR
jgi:16S rRNA G1207 methylase RsmC